MIDVDIDPNDWEERRRLSFALAMLADRPQALTTIYRGLTRAAHKLWATVAPRPSGRIIGLSLLVLALLAAADAWSTQAASDSPFAQYTSPETDNAKTIGAASPPPAKVASVPQCKAFLIIGISHEGMSLGLCAMPS
jgi:hypothetical protein